MATWIVPYPLAMLICDEVVQGPLSRKTSVLGCFASIAFRDFPAVHPGFTVYVSLTDGRGRVPLRIKLVAAADEGDPIAEAETEIDFIDPRAVVDFAAVLRNVVFPRPDEYRLQLFAGDEFVIERRIVVSLRTPEAESNE